MRKQLLPALRMLIVLSVITGLAYPLAMTGVAQALFRGKADGSLVKVDGKVVGSALVGQQFTGGQYFHGRPSAAGAGASGSMVPRTDADGNEVVGADGAPVVAPADVSDLANDGSGASNLGPTNPDLLTAVKDRVIAYREENGLAANAPVPVDAVTASASGLDPQISVANAKLQALRVAKARGLDVGEVLRLVHEHTDGRSLGFLGEAGVNVLGLNLALDARS